MMGHSIPYGHKERVPEIKDEKLGFKWGYAEFKVTEREGSLGTLNL